MNRMMLRMAGIAGYTIWMCFLTISVWAQKQTVLTGEDSLHQGLNMGTSTLIGGYGEAAFQRDFNEGVSHMNLVRTVLFVGHQFNDQIAFFSELELEDAKVEGGDAGGEIAMEQAYLKFSSKRHPQNYLVAGLFIPRIGLLNEDHLPVNYNGVERPLVEQLVIPATWRELGVGYYATSSRWPLQYTVAVVNGLDAADFSHGSGIREGRFEGRDATANNLAVTASLRANPGEWQLQVSGYVGGTNGLNKRASDSLGLAHGWFALPLYLGEADVQYRHEGFHAKALGAYIRFPDASAVNKAYANNVASGMYGAYVELAYNLFARAQGRFQHQQLNLFARFEWIDLNQQIPANAIYDGTLRQSHLIVGLGYLPIPNVVIKADVRLQHTGPQNPDLIVNPNPAAPPYQQNNTFLNLGLGYSF
jgi:hypothetical protein